MAKKDRIHRIISALPPLDGDDRLVLDTLSYEDALGRPFECTIDVLSEDHSIDDQDLLGTSLTVSHEPVDGRKHFINGLVSEVAYFGIFKDYSRYQIIIRPWFWFLKHTTDSRIFQKKSVPEIISVICKDTHSFTDFKITLNGKFEKRDYCVQYRESDFDFVSRLLEEEGIYYYTDHTEEKHTLVFVDDSASHKPIKGDTQDKVEFRSPGKAPVDLKHISEWTFSSRVQPTNVTLNDYNFEEPKADLAAKSTITRKHQLSKFEKYDFPGRYMAKNVGTQLAKRWAEEQQLDSNEFLASGNEPALATGLLFKMVSHPRKDQNDVKYLITRSSVRIVSGEIEVFSKRENERVIDFAAIKQTQQFRPHRLTPRPIVTGPQSAVVVGKSGEEIWTDKYGRVKVQFPWDREGKNDEDSSCWIRVSHTWAGKGWGSVHIPRLGQEVLVEFLNGDPDQPIITGRVYNAIETTPYALPANQTQSGIKSHSTKTGKDDNFNELRFEDQKDEEEIYFHAEKDFTQVVENNANIKIGLDKKDKGDQTIEVHNKRAITVNEGDETIDIKKGNRILTVDKGNQTIEIKVGDRSVDVGGKETDKIKNGRTTEVTSGGDATTVKAGNHTVSVKSGKQETDASQEIVLKVGGSSIKIGPSSITIKSPEIKIEGSGQVTVKGAMTEVSGSGTLMLKGGIVKIN